MASPGWAALSFEAAPAAAPGLQFTDSCLAGAVQSQDLLQNVRPRTMQWHKGRCMQCSLEGAVQLLLALNSTSRMAISTARTMQGLCWHAQPKALLPGVDVRTMIRIIAPR